MGIDNVLVVRDSDVQ